MNEEIKPEMCTKIAHYNWTDRRYEIKLDEWSPILWRDGRCGRFVSGDIVDKLAAYENIDCDPYALKKRIKDLEDNIKRLEEIVEPKKCPFCGSDTHISMIVGTYEATCLGDDCFLSEGVDLATDEYIEAVAKWNKRAEGEKKC